MRVPWHDLLSTSNVRLMRLVEGDGFLVLLPGGLTTPNPPWKDFMHGHVWTWGLEGMPGSPIGVRRRRMLGL